MLLASLSLARIAAGSSVVVLNAIQGKVVTVEVAREMVVVLVEAASEVHHVGTCTFFCDRQPQICIWGSSYARSDVSYQ